MNHLERIGVSVDKELLGQFDRLIKKRGYKSRSEALRDLVREEISKEQLANPEKPAVAAVCIVYNHHSRQLMQKLTDLQHSHLLHTICTTHIHLTKDDCMEIIVLRGKAGDIHRMAEQMISQKGVKLGRVNMIGSNEENSNTVPVTHTH